MSYSKTNWVDHIVDPTTGEVVQQGTKVTATRLNKMEQGIADAHSLVEGLAQQVVGSAVVSGLEFTSSGLTASWTAGVAYVNGVRFDVPAGSIALNPTQGQYLYLDSDGAVKLTTSQATADAKCPLWYFATDASGVITSIDRRNVITASTFVKQSEVAANGPNKIPRLNAQGRGEFSITGDAVSVGGKTVGTGPNQIPTRDGAGLLHADTVGGRSVGTGANQLPTRDGFGRLVADMTANYKVTKSGKDANGIFTTVEYRRPDDTLFMRSVLSNPDANGNYQTDTWTFYAADGTTPVETKVWTITYDVDGDITSIA